MNIKPIIERISTASPEFALVGGAAKMERARQGLTAMPAAFVLPLGERAGPNDYQMEGCVQQRVGFVFGVWIAARNLQDATGAATIDELEQLRMSVRGALLGWQPRADCEQIRYRGGSVQGMRDGIVVWVDRYFTGYLLRKLPNAA